MPPLRDNQGTPEGNLGTPGIAGVSPAASAAGPAVRPPGSPAAAPAAATAALAVRESGVDEPEPQEIESDTRLDRLSMQVDVLVKIQSFRVQDLLAMEKGMVVETVHEHTQDVPVRCGGALLMWSEFEVLDQQLAVRVTRLA